jgi:hypothetical protein
VLYEDLGLTALQVGVLLSANRWIRLLTNELAHRAAHLARPAAVFAGALVLGSVTTAGYAVTSSFVVLLIARVCWGLAWSFIRHLGVGAVMSGVPLYAVGRTMGTYNGISRAGSVAGLFGGAMVVDWLGFHAGVVLLAIVSLLGVPLAWRGFDDHIVDREVVRRPAPAQLLLLGVALGAVGPGFVMATLGASLARYVGADALVSATALTGALLSARYLMDTLLAPALGWSFDRLGFRRAAGAYFSLGGLALLLAATGPGLAAFVLCVLTFFAVGTALQAGVAGTASRLGSGAYARYVTASDFGAAAGPLLGWIVVAALGDPLYSIAIGGVLFLASLGALLVPLPPEPAEEGGDQAAQ